MNLFLEHYEEDYDFVYLFTDHAIAGVAEAGVFEPVTRPAGPGGVSEYEIRADGYETTGRVKGVVGIPYGAVNYPPLLHETAHYWAVDLDGRFGFGQGFDASSTYPSHWGFASINGQLGGFEGSTLRCETPAGAMPPACTAQTGGRTRYVLGQRCRRVRSLLPELTSRRSLRPLRPLRLCGSKQAQLARERSSPSGCLLRRRDAQVLHRARVAAELRR